MPHSHLDATQPDDVRSQAAAGSTIDFLILTNGYQIKSAVNETLNLHASFNFIFNNKNERRMKIFHR